MNTYDMIRYLKQFYPTLRGRAWEDVSEGQVIAIYYSMRQREEKRKTLPSQSPIKPKASENQLTFLN